MIREYQEITDQEIDMLCEAGNIASGNAMTSLSQLIQASLDMSIAKVRIEKIEALPEVLGNPEEVIAGMLINITGDLEAMLLLALETESAINIVNRLLNKKLENLEAFGEIEHSVLCETGNILAGSYLSALNTFTGLKLDMSPPEAAIDMAGAVLSYPAITFVRNGDAMLFIETIFKDTNGLLNGTYILILSDNSYHKVIDSLGACL